MKIVPVALLMMALTSAGADIDSATVSEFQSGRQNVFSPGAQSKILTLSLLFLQSASIENRPSVATEQHFEEARQKPHLHLTFSTPRGVNFKFATEEPNLVPTSERTVAITELVIPISPESSPAYTDYIFVRENGKIRAFCKFRYEQWKALQDALKNN